MVSCVRFLLINEHFFVHVNAFLIEPPDLVLDQMLSQGVTVRAGEDIQIQVLVSGKPSPKGWFMHPENSLINSCIQPENQNY